MNGIQRLLALLALGLLSGLLTARPMAAAPPPLPGMDAMMRQMDQDIGMLTGLRGKDFEIEFMRLMIGHHESALRVAEMAPTKTKRPELVSLANDIVAAQKREIASMRGWLDRWYGIAKPVIDPSAGEAEMLPAMMAMNGPDFEQSFLAMMTMHHQGALDMAKLAPSRATRPELLALADDIVNAQAGEIKQMRDWAMAWYGFDPMTGMGGGAHGGGMPGMPNTGSGSELSGLTWAIPAGLAVTIVALFFAPLVARFFRNQRRQ